MTIPLTGAGSLGVRWGHIFGGIADMLALKGGTATARVLVGASWATRVGTIEADFAAGTTQYGVIDGFASAEAVWSYGGIGSSGAGADTAFINDLATRAQNTIIQMANTDLLQPNLTLKTALAYLQNQMTANATSINASTVAIGAQTNGTPAPKGNPILFLTNFLPNGLLYQTTFPETITATITADSLGSATLNQEPVNFVGQQAYQVWDYRWPGGSGCNVSFNLCDASVNNTGSNLLTNGEVTAWSNGTQTPDNWIDSVGAAQVSKDTTNSYLGTDPSVLFTGDSATLTAIWQPFNTAASTNLNAGGTPAKLSPSTIYIVNLFYRLTLASPAAGVLEIALTQSDKVTIINDDQGVANSTTVALTGVANTNWHNLTFAIRTPFNMVTAQGLRIRLSTALTTGTNLDIARISMMKGVQLYTGGPWAGGFSGSTKCINGITPDNWTFAITNTYGQFASYLERSFGMRALGLQLPYSGSPTIGDALIT